MTVAMSAAMAMTVFVVAIALVVVIVIAAAVGRRLWCVGIDQIHLHAQILQRADIDCVITRAGIHRDLWAHAPGDAIGHHRDRVVAVSRRDVGIQIDSLGDRAQVDRQSSAPLPVSRFRSSELFLPITSDTS